MFLFFIHCFPYLLLVVQDGLLVSAADHAHFLLSWQFELELCWATFGEDARDVGHICWINVVSDIPFNPVRVSVLGCVLVVDIADNKPKVKGELLLRTP